MNQKHLTENEIIQILERYFIDKNYSVECCYGTKKGCDIIATKPKNKNVYIEAKGARPANNSRPVFESKQISTHFGKAIYQILRRISDNQDYNRKYEYAIAHPNDPVIRKVIEKLTPFLKDFGIIHYWVNEDGSVIKE